MALINIQLVPTPQFGCGRAGLFRYTPEGVANFSATLVSCLVQESINESIAESPQFAATIVSALYVEPVLQTATDSAALSATLFSAQNTNPSFQRDVSDSAAIESQIVSVFIFSPKSEFSVDTSNFSSNLVSATVMNSANFALFDGTAQTRLFAHGLAAAPAYVRMVLSCTTADSNSGLTVGKEVDLGSSTLIDLINSNTVFAANADSTNICLSYSGDAGTNVGIVVNGLNKNFSSFSNFSMKVYWQ